MSAPFEEILEGRTFTRPPPSERHELICRRLHALIRSSTANVASARLLEARTRIQINKDTHLCPDLSLVTAATEKLWLAVEIVGREDHRLDTVVKKEIYEAVRVPRLWMVDPRYDNVEIYHATQHGLILQRILAGNDLLGEKLIPELSVTIAELFSDKP